MSIYLGATIISLALLCAERRRISQQAVNARKRRILQQLQDMESGQAITIASPIEETALPAESPIEETTLPTGSPIEETALPAESPIEKTALRTKSPGGNAASLSGKHKLSDLYNAR